MKVVINDKTQETESQNLAGLLQELKLDQEAAIAVAVDAQVVPRSGWSTFAIKENTQILIIRAAQGG